MNTFNNVKNPKHYVEGRKFEPKDVIRDWELNFNLGNAVKYISRAGRKEDVIEDLKKAIQYIEFEIEALGENDVTEEDRRKTLADKAINVFYGLNSYKIETGSLKDAEAILEEIQDIIILNRHITVSEMLDLTGVKEKGFLEGSPAGWKEWGNMHIRQEGQKYYVVLPNPRRLY